MRSFTVPLVLSTLFAAALMAQNPVMRNLMCVAGSGSSTTYACNMPAVPPAYAAGTLYAFQADMANTGAATINFNSLGAKSIKKTQGGAATDLATNDIRAGQWVILIYDGTNMQMLSLLGNGSSGGGGTWGSITGALSNQTDLQTALNGLASLSGSYANPSWITSLAWAKLTGVPGTIVQNNQSNAYTTGTQDFSGAAHTLPVKTGTLAAKPATCTVGEAYFATDGPAGSNLYGCTAANTWTLEGAAGTVASVFGRTGAVAPQGGDYTASQVTNAVDSTGSYSNPAWISSLGWAKLTGVPSTFTPSAHASTHASGGGDVITPAAIGALAATNPDIGSSALTIEYANDTSTGTTTKYLVKLSGSNKRVIVAGAANAGLVGVCLSNCGTSGNAAVAIRGRVTCTFDNATTEADYVQADGATGKCHDVGAAFPTSGGQIIGQSLETGAAGDHEIRIGAEVQAVASGSTTINVQAGTSYTLQASDNGAVISFTSASPVTLTVPAGLGAGFNVGIIQAGAGVVTPTASSTTLHQRLSLTKSAGQYAYMALVAYAADTFVLSGDMQ